MIRSRFHCILVNVTAPTSPEASILESAIWTSSSVMSKSKSFSQSSLTSVLDPGDGKTHLETVCDLHQAAPCLSLLSGKLTTTSLNLILFAVTLPAWTSGNRTPATR